MEELKWVNPKNYIIKEKIQELLNSGGTDKEIIDALKELDRDVIDTGNLDHLPVQEKKKIKRETKQKSILIYKAIKKINKEEGDLYLKLIDN